VIKGQVPRPSRSIRTEAQWEAGLVQQRALIARAAPRSSAPAKTNDVRRTFKPPFACFDKAGMTVGRAET
jgi:hypothetical protein